MAALSNKRGLLYLLVDKARLQHHHAAASNLQSYLGKFKVVSAGGGWGPSGRSKRSLIGALDDGDDGAGGDDGGDEGPFHQFFVGLVRVMQTGDGSSGLLPECTAEPLVYSTCKL